jgi:hypothetical protein
LDKSSKKLLVGFIVIVLFFAWIGISDTSQSHKVSEADGISKVPQIPRNRSNKYEAIQIAKSAVLSELNQHRLPDSPKNLQPAWAMNDG